MEDKKFDFNSLIGFVLLGAIMLWWMYTNQPTPEEIAAEKKAETEQVQESETNTSTANFNSTTETAIQVTDSLSIAKAQSQLGDFAYSATLSDEETVLENDVLKLVISNKGGQIKEALIKNYVTYDSLPLYMVKDQNASFNINFGTSENRILNTKDLQLELCLMEFTEIKLQMETYCN